MSSLEASLNRVFTDVFTQSEIRANQQEAEKHLWLASQFLKSVRLLQEFLCRQESQDD